MVVGEHRGAVPWVENTGIRFPILDVGHLAAAELDGHPAIPSDVSSDDLDTVVAACRDQVNS